MNRRQFFGAAIGGMLAAVGLGSVAKRFANTPTPYLRFPGGTLYVCSTESAARLRSKQFEPAFLDEIDDYPMSDDELQAKHEAIINSPGFSLYEGSPVTFRRRS